MIHELKTLVAVAREGTFAAAGHRIGLTQAAVSAQMRRLETELGFALFDRVGRSARLNKAGQRTLSQAQELIRLYGALGTASLGQADGVLVNIGVIASLQNSVLPDALAKFHRQYPGCRTRVIPGLSIELVDRVDVGEIDVAAIIRPAFALHGDLSWTLLAHEPFRLIVPRDLPGEDWMELLAGQPFIRYDRASFGGRQVSRFLRDRNLVPHEVCEADDLDVIVKLVAHGVGVALVPQTTTQRRWPVAVRAIDLGKHTFHRDVGLVHRVPRLLEDPVKALVRMLAMQVGGARMRNP